MDMDEILTDFVGGVSNLFNALPEDVMAAWPAGEWDIEPPLTKALGYDRPDDRVDMWEAITEAGAWFWENLDQTPWYAQMLEVVSRYSDDWWIVSSPSRHPLSYSGKAYWLKKRLGAKFNRFHLTPYKEQLARADTVLIDDRDRNVVRFIKAGGHGIVFPRHHNSAHPFKGDPVTIVEAKLKALHKQLDKPNL